MLTGEGQLRGQRESGLLFVASEEADRGRYPSGRGLRVKGKRAGGRAARGRRGRPKGGRGEPWHQPALPGTRFRLPHTQPLSGPPFPGRQRREQLFPPGWGRGGKGIPGSGGQACGGRLHERDTTPRRLPPSQRQTWPFPPLSLLYPPTSRPPVSASANRYRPPHVLLLAASHPSSTPQGWGRARPQGRSRARRGALESQMPPPTKRSHPLRGSLARPDAANSSHLH